MTPPIGIELALERVVESVVRRVVREELERIVPPPAPGKLGTTEEYGALHGIRRSTVRAYIRRGQLQAVRVGRQWRLRLDQPLGTPAVPDAPAAHAARILGRRP